MPGIDGYWVEKLIRIWQIEKLLIREWPRKSEDVDFCEKMTPVPEECEGWYYVCRCFFVVSLECFSHRSGKSWHRGEAIQGVESFHYVTTVKICASARLYRNC